MWHDEIGRALARCDWFVLVLSPEAVLSNWVKRELIYSLQQDRFEGHIVPLLYQACDYDELSWTLSQLQMEAQREFGLPEHSLVTDCQTRWGSTQKTIGRVLEQEKAIRKVLGGDRKTSHLVPTWQDLDVLESLNSILAPLSDFTDMLSAEDYVSVSAILPVLKVLHDNVCNVSDDDTTLTSEILSAKF